MNAKREADGRLQESNLTYTVVRPDPLTDEPATGRIEAAERVERGEIARADVARTPVIALDTENTYGRTFEMIGGDEPIAVAAEPRLTSTVVPSTSRRCTDSGRRYTDSLDRTGDLVYPAMANSI